MTARARLKPPAFTEADLARLSRMVEAMGKAGTPVKSVEIGGFKIEFHSPTEAKPEQDMSGDAYLARLDKWQGRS